MTQPDSGAVPTLRRESGRLQARLPGAAETTAVTAVLLRPLTARDDLALIDDEGHEVALLPGLDALDPASRALVAAELRERYFMPIIERVSRVSITFGTQYWRVHTDRGARAFALKEPGKNLTWLTPDHVILRDTLGNRFEITSLAGLDDDSRRQALTVL